MPEDVLTVHSRLDSAVLTGLHLFYGQLPIWSKGKAHRIYVPIHKRHTQCGKRTQNGKKEVLSISIKRWKKRIIFTRKKDWIVSSFLRWWSKNDQWQKQNSLFLYTSYYNNPLPFFLNENAIYFHDIFLFLIPLILGRLSISALQPVP